MAAENSRFILAAKVAACIAALDHGGLRASILFKMILLSMETKKFMSEMHYSSVWYDSFPI